MKMSQFYGEVISFDMVLRHPRLIFLIMLQFFNRQHLKNFIALPKSFFIVLFPVNSFLRMIISNCFLWTVATFWFRIFRESECDTSWQYLIPVSCSFITAGHSIVSKFCVLRLNSFQFHVAIFRFKIKSQNWQYSSQPHQMQSNGLSYIMILIAG